MRNQAVQRIQNMFPLLEKKNPGQFKKMVRRQFNDTQKKEKDYWGPSIKMMMDPGFLKSLINYEKEEI